MTSRTLEISSGYMHQKADSSLLVSTDRGPYSAGRALREAREQQGLSIQQVAKQLNLMSSHIRSLESDSFNPELEKKNFPEYLMSYARLLGLKPASLLYLYRHYTQDNRQNVAYEKVNATPAVWKSHWATIGLCLVAITTAWLAGDDEEEPLPSIAESTVVEVQPGILRERTSRRVMHLAEIKPETIPSHRIHTSEIEILAPLNQSVSGEVLAAKQLEPADVRVGQHVTSKSEPLLYQVRTTASGSNKPTRNFPVSEALAQAVHRNDLSRLDALLEAGVTPNATDAQGTPVLVIAATRGLYEASSRLLKANVELEQKDRLGNSALMSAAIHGNNSLIQLLLERGANPNTTNRQGRTPLMAVAWNEHAMLIPVLLEAGASINYQNQDGWTALIHAAWKGNRRVVEALLSRGANSLLRNHRGDTAFDVAFARNHQEVIAQL